MIPWKRPVRHKERYYPGSDRTFGKDKWSARYPVSFRGSFNCLSNAVANTQDRTSLAFLHSNVTPRCIGRSSPPRILPILSWVDQG